MDMILKTTGLCKNFKGQMAVNKPSRSPLNTAGRPLLWWRLLQTTARPSPTS